jgi:hypothetical protein
MRDPYDPWADERATTTPPTETTPPREPKPTHLTPTAIQACNLCNTEGQRDGFPCDHTNHKPAATRGMTEIRRIMGWKTPTTNTNPQP